MSPPPPRMRQAAAPPSMLRRRKGEEREDRGVMAERVAQRGPDLSTCQKQPNACLSPGVSRP
jgi:hypothetical protein